MNKKLLEVLACLAVSTIATSAFAFNLPAVPSATGGAAASGGASAEQIVKKYVGGTKNVISADTNMLKALGLKDQAAKSELSAKTMTEGATSDALEDAAKVQTESSKAIEAKMTGEKVVMDAASKKQFANGMVDLASGIKQYIGMSSDVKGFKPSVSSVGGATGSAIFIAKSLPTSTSNLMGTLKKAIEFSKANDIAVPKEASEAATAKL